MRVENSHTERPGVMICYINITLGIVHYVWYVSYT